MTRIPCLIPFCRCTTRAGDPAIEWPDDAWICSKHWRQVPAKFKAVKRRARRALRAAGALDEHGRYCGQLAPLRRFKLISARCTRAAIEAAVGIA
jgi:hypothetical protein